MDTAMPNHSRLSLYAHIGATLKLGLPLVGAQLAHLAINTTDTVMIGWLGTRELAASVLAFQGYFIFMMLGSGFAHAIMPMVAQASGTGHVRTARRAVRMGLWIVTFFSALAMAALWHFEAILVALGQDADVAALSGDYMRIMQWSLFTMLFTFVMRSFLSALEHARMMISTKAFQRVVWEGVEMHLRGSTTPEQREALDELLKERHRYSAIFRAETEAARQAGLLSYGNISIANQLMFMTLNSPIFWYTPRPGESPDERERIARQVVTFALRGLGASEESFDE